MVLGQGHSLRVLGVGVRHHVGGFPMEIERSRTARTAQLGCAAIRNGLVRTCIGYGGGIYSDSLSLRAGAVSIAATHREGYWVVACIGILVRWVLLC